MKNDGGIIKKRRNGKRGGEWLEGVRKRLLQRVEGVYGETKI